MSGSGLGIVLQAEIDPNVARPGWIPLLITALLLGALTLLYLSLRKQLRKIHVPDDDRREAEAREPQARQAEPRSAVPKAAAPEAEPQPPESR